MLQDIDFARFDIPSAHLQEIVMEILGFFVPTWVLFLTIYMIGMPIIGYPIGKFSLKAWRYYPTKYSILGKILFPLNGFEGSIGKYDTDNYAFPVILQILNANDALVNGNQLPLAKYIVVQMMIWPIRVIWTLGFTVIFYGLRWAYHTPTFAGKLLLRCKRCVEI